MDANLDAVAAELSEVEHVHATAFASVDGEDSDWAIFYANRLIDHSSLPSIVGDALASVPLAQTLAELDRCYVAEKPDETWERYYARGLLERYGTTGAQTR